MAVMRATRFFLLLLLMPCLCGSCTDRQSMQKRLAYVSACNRADTVFSARWIPTVDSLVDYFNRHGSANERMQAHYLQGRVHHDMGEAPRALDCYQQAIEQADTTAKECDFYTLAAVYGQMAELFHWQNLPHSEITARKKYRDYAFLLHDTLDYINGKVQMVKPYYLLGEKDSVLQILDEACLMYIKQGYRSYAAGLLPPSIYINTERGNYQEAKRLINIFEHESGLFDTQGNILKGREHYYCTKGVYFLKTGQVDSSEYYFRKSIPFGYHVDAFRGILSVYRERKNADSIAKYSLLYEDAIDNNNQKIQTTSVQLATSLYNYNQAQRIAEQNEKEAEHNRRKFIFSVFLLIAIALTSILIIRQLRQKRKAQEKELAATIAERAKMQAELKLLKEANYEMVISQKEEEIDSLNKILAKQATVYNRMMAKDRVSEFEKSSIVELFIRKSEFKYGDTMPTNIEWDTLIKEFHKDLPTLYTLMTDACHLSSTEFRACILILIGISEGSIASLLEILPQTLNTSKIRANKKMFNAKGSATLKDNLMQLIVT